MLWIGTRKGIPITIHEEWSKEWALHMYLRASDTFGRFWYIYHRFLPVVRIHNIPRPMNLKASIPSIDSLNFSFDFNLRWRRTVKWLANDAFWFCTTTDNRNCRSSFFWHFLLWLIHRINQYSFCRCSACIHSFSSVELFFVFFSFHSQKHRTEAMGNTDSKVDFRVAVVQLTSRSQVGVFFVDDRQLTLSPPSKSSRMTNLSGINSGRIKSPACKICSP